MDSVLYCTLDCGNQELNPLNPVSVLFRYDVQSVITRFPHPVQSLCATEPTRKRQQADCVANCHRSFAVRLVANLGSLRRRESRIRLAFCSPTRRLLRSITVDSRRGAQNQKAHSPVYGRCARDKMHSRRAGSENKACSSKQQDRFVV